MHAGTRGRTMHFLVTTTCVRLWVKRGPELLHRSSATAGGGKNERVCCGRVGALMNDAHLEASSRVGGSSLCALGSDHLQGRADDEVGVQVVHGGKVLHGQLGTCAGVLQGVSPRAVGVRECSEGMSGRRIGRRAYAEQQRCAGNCNAWSSCNSSDFAPWKVPGGARWSCCLCPRSRSASRSVPRALGSWPGPRRACRAASGRAGASQRRKEGRTPSVPLFQRTHVGRCRGEDSTAVVVVLLVVSFRTEAVRASTPPHRLASPSRGQYARTHATTHTTPHA